jgi:predicted PurR-regulated permease PerM
MVLLPVLGVQVAAFIEALPRDLTRLRDLLSEQGAGILVRFAPIAERFGVQLELGAYGLPGSASDLASEAARYAGGVLKSLWSGGRALIGLVSLVVITPVVAFYILLDWDRMVAKIDSWLPRDEAQTIRILAAEINAALSGFLRGQSLVCLFLATWYGAGLSLVGLNYGLLIGITGGFLSFIPFVGSLSCLIISVAIAIVQGWPQWTLLVMVLGVIGVGQFLEGNILTPKLVGGSVGLHPVWLMLALLGFGSIFGFTGLLLAVPIAAAVGVLMRFALRHYLASSLYLGKGPQA